MNPRTIERKEFYNLLGTETLYFYNDYEDIVIKAVPHGDKIRYFAKIRGKAEYEPAHGSKLVADTLLQPLLITANEYSRF